MFPKGFAGTRKALGEGPGRGRCDSAGHLHQGTRRGPRLPFRCGMRPPSLAGPSEAPGRCLRVSTFRSDRVWEGLSHPRRREDPAGTVLE